MLEGGADHNPLDPASATVPVPDFTSNPGQNIEDAGVYLCRSLHEHNCDPRLVGPCRSCEKY